MSERIRFKLTMMSFRPTHDEVVKDQILTLRAWPGSCFCMVPTSTGSRKGDSAFYPARTAKQIRRHPCGPWRRSFESPREPRSSAYRVRSQRIVLPWPADGKLCNRSLMRLPGL